MPYYRGSISQPFAKALGSRQVNKVYRRDRATPRCGARNELETKLLSVMRHVLHPIAEGYLAAEIRLKSQVFQSVVRTAPSVKLDFYSGQKDALSSKTNKTGRSEWSPIAADVNLVASR